MTNPGLKEAATAEIVAELGIPESPEDELMHAVIYGVAVEMQRNLFSQEGLDPSARVNGGEGYGVVDFCRWQARCMALVLLHGADEGVNRFQLEGIGRRLRQALEVLAEDERQHRELVTKGWTVIKGNDNDQA